MGRLLLADSRQLFIHALRALLDHEGEHEVVAVCTTPPEVLTEVDRQRPDLALIDVELAGPEGTASLVGTVVGSAPATKVVLLAGEPGVELVAAAVRAGAIGVIDRASDVRTILRAARAALRGEGVVARSMLPSLFRHLIHEDTDDPLDQLSVREREVLALMGQGLNNAKIAAGLGISPNTVRTHVQNVLAKLGMHSKLEAVTYATRHATALPRSAGRGRPG